LIDACLSLTPMAIDPTVPPTTIIFVAESAVPTTMAFTAAFWLVEVPAVNVVWASPNAPVVLVDAITGLSVSPVPVELTKVNCTGAPPTGLPMASMTFAVKVAVLEVVPELGGTTETLDCSEIALAAFAVIEKMKLAVEITAPVASRASI